MNADTREWATRGKRATWWQRNRARALAVAIAIALVCGSWYAFEHAAGLRELGKRDANGPTASESWYSSFPEEHGLYGQALVEAGEQLRRALPVRDCFLVIRDGTVLHEEYYDGADLNSAFDVGGVGKVAMTLGIGAMMKKYGYSMESTVTTLLRADGEQPYLADVPTGWNSDYWGSLTLRQLLGQVSSNGSREPGVEFSDDEEFNDKETSPLQILNKVLRAVTREAPTQWLDSHLAVPLGLDGFFDSGASEDGDVSATGGQLATCRDMARFGQLIVNGGKWKKENGELKQIVDPVFLKEMLTPMFPAATSHYGYSGWVYNTQVSDAEPREESDIAGLGEDCPLFSGPVAPGEEPKYDVLFNTGALGSAMITIPSSKTIVLSFGQTWSSSSRCPAASLAKKQTDLESSEKSILPRNDLVAVQEIWKITKTAIEPVDERIVHKLSMHRRPSYGSVWSSLHHKTEEPKKRAIQSLGQNDENAYNDKMEQLVNSVTDEQAAASQANTEANEPVMTWDEDDFTVYTGTCTCSCAPSLDIGQCFNVVNSRSQNCDDLNLRSHGERFCPELGIVNSCDAEFTVSADEYGSSSTYSAGNVSDLLSHSQQIKVINKQINPKVQKISDVSNSVFTCTVEQGCGDDHTGHFWSNKEGRYGEDMFALRCAPTGFTQCTFTSGATCDFTNVKMPLTNVSIAQGSNEALVEMPTEGWVLQTEHKADGGSLGEDVSYSKLRIPGRRSEHVQLLKDNEGTLLVFNALYGVTIVVLGFVLVALAKGNYDEQGESESEAPLVKSSDSTYGTDSV
jgi:CubicO group peptidase (beta-lactamase class C family)